MFLAAPSAFALQPPHAWRTAQIDYSAANEYVATHYSSLYGGSKERYFEAATRASEPIYDGRLGIWDDAAAASAPASLASCGFQLLQQSSAPGVCWDDGESVRSSYLPRLRQQLTAAVEGSAAHGSVVELVFWHPVLREEGGSEQSERGIVRSGFVSMAHVDTDVNAYAGKPEALAHLVLDISTPAISPTP